jgi:hypothetical protein
MAATVVVRLSDPQPFVGYKMGDGRFTLVNPKAFLNAAIASDMGDNRRG